MSKITIFVVDAKLEELKVLTKGKTVEEAVARAVQFTLLHDKNSVLEALMGKFI